MPYVVDYATPQQQQRRPWLIVLVTVTILALVAGGLFSYVAIRQRELARRALQQQAAQRAAMMAALRQQVQAAKATSQTQPASPLERTSP